MCCEYGARLHSYQNVFRAHLSEFSGFAPGNRYGALLYLWLPWSEVTEYRYSCTAVCVLKYNGKNEYQGITKY